MLDKEVLERERSFHDERFKHGGDSRSDQDKYYIALESCTRDFEARIDRLVPGKQVLDFGCANGWASLRRASSASQVFGIDISSEAIASARQQAASRHLTNATYIVGDAHHTGFPDNSFDVVFGSGIIHHLDLERSFQEIHRVLKPGGTAVFREPLGLNFAFNLYRKLTPTARTVDEHPLMPADFDYPRRLFRTVDLEFYGLLTLAAVPFRNHAAGRRILSALERVDRAVLSIPGLKWQGWYVIFEFRK